MEERKPTLRELRDRRCCSVSEVARALGRPENTVYRWERGEMVPSVLHALALAQFYRVGVEEVNWWPHGLRD